MMNFWTKFSQRKSISLAWSYAQIITLLVFIIAALVVIAYNTPSILPKNVLPTPGTRIILEPEKSVTPFPTQLSTSHAILVNPGTTSTPIPDEANSNDTVPMPDSTLQTNGFSASRTDSDKNISNVGGVVSALSREGQLVSEGLRLHRYGDYDGSQIRLAAVVVSDVGDIETYLNAHFLLARTYLANDNYQSALSTLDRLDEVLDSNEGQGATAFTDLKFMATFLRGEIQTELGQHGLAITAYGRFLGQFPWMAEVIYPKIGEAYLALGDNSGAASAYYNAAVAASSTGDNIAYVQLLEKLAQIYKGMNRYDGALTTYDEILSVAKNPYYRAEIEFYAGEVLGLEGDLPAAIQRWQAATQAAPDSAYAHKALVELVNNQVEFDLYQRGVINSAARSWWPALRAFEGFLDSAPSTDERIGPAMYGIGQAYLGANDYVAAIAAFDEVQSKLPNCTCIGDVWLDEASALANQGDTVAARRTYRTFARDYVGHPLAAEALWRSGRLALREGNQIETAVDFLTLADIFSGSERAPDALYALGLGALQEAFYDQALLMYERLQEDYPTYKPSAVAYWRGRAYYATDQSAKAKAQWQQLVNDRPDMYYAVLAAHGLASSNLTTDLTQGRILQALPQLIGPASTLAGDDGSQAFAEQWLASWIENFDPSTALPANPHLRMGKMLLTLDQRGDALAMLERVHTQYKDDSQALYALSLEFERLGVYRLSLIASVRLLDFSPARLVEDAPIFLQKRSYPQPFADLVIEEALDQDINPLVFFSLVRQESLFEEGAISSAAAQGLAQIIPDTAKWVADRLVYPDYTNGLVYRPHVNLKFGAYYLHWTRGYLDDNLISALVGYNAGPGNAERWRTLSGPDDTLFVEILQVTEPRIYVQRVTENLYHYTRLYGPE